MSPQLIHPPQPPGQPSNAASDEPSANHNPLLCEIYHNSESNRAIARSCCDDYYLDRPRLLAAHMRHTNCTLCTERLRQRSAGASSPPTLSQPTEATPMPAPSNASIVVPPAPARVPPTIPPARQGRPVTEASGFLSCQLPDGRTVVVSFPPCNGPYSDDFWETTCAGEKITLDAWGRLNHGAPPRPLRSTRPTAVELALARRYCGRCRFYLEQREFPPNVHRCVRCGEQSKAYLLAQKGKAQA